MSEEQRIEEPEMAWTLDPKTFKPKQYRKSWWYYDKAGSLRHRNGFEPKHGSYATEGAAIAAVTHAIQSAVSGLEHQIARAESEVDFHQKRLDGFVEERMRVVRISRKLFAKKSVGSKEYEP